MCNLLNQLKHNKVHRRFCYELYIPIKDNKLLIHFNQITKKRLKKKTETRPLIKHTEKKKYKKKYSALKMLLNVNDK